MNNNTIHKLVFHWHNLKARLVMESIIIGIFTAFIVVSYRCLLEKAAHFTPVIYHWQSLHPCWIPIWFLLLIVIGCLVGKLITQQPIISGSGIPQVKGVLLGQLQMNWWKTLLGKFFGGVLAISAGMSLGREGPSVQLGATVGQGCSQLLKRPKIEEKFLLTAGASAGLSAAFNAPLAGVIFALEEIHKNFSPLVLLSAFSASLAADFVSKQFFGLQPVFHFHELRPLPLQYYLYLIFLGIFVGFLGMMFNQLLFKSQTLYEQQEWLPAQFRPMLPLLMAGILGFYLPEVLGGGTPLINLLTEQNLLSSTLLFLFSVKLLFTMFCYGSGAPGGIFFPLLVLGALIGNFYGNLLFTFLHLPKEYVTNFISLAMAGYFTAIVKSPITGIVLITEMTGSFQQLLALSLVSMTAYLTTEVCRSKPVYESLLEKIVSKKNGQLPIALDQKIILEIPILLGSLLDEKTIKDIAWPKQCLLIGVKRGESELIPHGSTKMQAGDYLIILTEEQHMINVRQQLEQFNDHLL